jgi:hypothetical protein
LFLRKLALSVNRLDFWNLEEELTPYELANHYTAESISPTGEERADMRAAVQTLLLLQAQMTKQIDREQSGRIVESMTNYLGLNETPCVDGDEAARIFGAM